MENKDIWLSIQSNSMMRDTMRALIQDIKKHNINYTSYGAQRRIYLHLKNVPQSFRDELNNWTHYEPVTQLSKPPKVSDYDIVDW